MNYTELTETINAIVNNNKLMMETATTPKMNKRNNPFYGRVSKHTGYIGINFRNYTEEVNNRRIEEGKTADFQALASIYTRINDYFVERNGQIYLRFLLDKDVKVKSIYYIDNRPATAGELDQIKTFFPPKKQSNRQDVQNEVQMRLVKIENIVSIGTENNTIVI